MTLKSDIIEGAFSLLRISGITVEPSPEDNVTALRRLEDFANEMQGRNVCTGYYFEDVPDINSPAGLEPPLHHSFKAILAARLMPDFGKGSQPDQSLVAQAMAGLSYIYSFNAYPSTTPYPNRQPVGSGNRRRGWGFRRYYSSSDIVDVPCENVLYVGGVNDYSEEFDSYLNDGESLFSESITADSGITVSADTIDGTNVTYRVTAGNNAGVYQITLDVVTDAGRITTRIIRIEVRDKE